ncbi:MAG TPA: ABC transporter ATP-binding protein, partial [Armatimonadota bacterium]|nr:ABC transporter ATP-binding protein [Armatimonadota bacterium]
MIAIESLSVSLGRFAMRDLSLTIGDGEYLVLLGPTGTGKTVLLESLLGLHRPDGGSIAIDGTDVTSLPPERRNLGYVPQDAALFPHMTVEGNLAYGLRARRMDRAETDARVADMMRLLRIGYLAGRMPHGLSAGERQRVALGRALAPKPPVCLLDEPLSALNESLRIELGRELARIQRETRATFVHICHSFDEASELADRVVLLCDGSVVQVGTVADLLDRPASEFVARFTCTRNLLPGCASPAPEGSVVALDAGPRVVSSDRAEGRVVVAIRPEHVTVADGGADGAAGVDGPNVWPGLVVSIQVRS